MCVQYVEEVFTVQPHAEHMKKGSILHRLKFTFVFRNLKYKKKNLKTLLFYWVYSKIGLEIESSILKAKFHG